MKMKKYLLLVIIALLSLTLMGCPKVQNSVPEFVQNVDGELKDINHITYEHVKGTDFDPNSMVQSLVENQGLLAIDYDQSKIIWGKNREYFGISDQIIVNSFYDIWVEGEDANFDGNVDAADEELYGTIKTDQDGNKIFDQNKILLVEILAVDAEINFTLSITDSDGAFTELSGTIVIVAAS